MTRRKSIIGAAFLCALCACAIGASNASATTLYVCEEGIAEETFSDAHCETKGAGKWITRAPLEGTAKEVTPTQTTVFSLEGFKLQGFVAKISCETLAGSGSDTNIIDGGGLMQVKGEKTILEFSQCAVKEPAGFGCKITGEKFSSKTLSSLTETVGGVTKVKLTPEAGTLIGEIAIEKCSEFKINGTYKIEGTLKGIVPAATPAKLEFSNTTGSAVTFGGMAATFVGTTHLVLKGTEKTIAIK